MLRELAGVGGTWLLLSGDLGAGPVAVRGQQHCACGLALLEDTSSLARMLHRGGLGWSDGETLLDVTAAPARRGRKSYPAPFSQATVGLEQLVSEKEGQAGAEDGIRAQSTLRWARGAGKEQPDVLPHCLLLRRGFAQAGKCNFPAQQA